MCVSLSPSFFLALVKQVPPGRRHVGVSLIILQIHGSAVERALELATVGGLLPFDRERGGKGVETTRRESLRTKTERSNSFTQLFVQPASVVLQVTDKAALKRYGEGVSSLRVVNQILSIAVP